eukprot:410834_1
MGDTYSSVCGKKEEHLIVRNIEQEVNPQESDKFRNWLSAIKLRQYLPQFQQHQLNDYRKINDFNYKQIENIMKNNEHYNKAHSRKIMKHITRHKKLNKLDELIGRLSNNDGDQNAIIKEQKQSDFDTSLFFCWFDTRMTDTGYKIRLDFVHNDHVYYHTFNTTFQIIKKLYQSVSSDKNRKKYFAIKTFPVFIPTEDIFTRGTNLQNKMNLMQKYMRLEPYFPAFPTNTNVITINKILCQFFNSPLFVAKKNLYNKLEMNCDVKTILQILGEEQLWMLETIATKRVNKDHKRLYEYSEYRNIEFKRVYLVQRENGPSTAHWALKFEGDTHLCSVDWFNNDKAYYQILENDENAFGQRIFWYSHIEDVSFNNKWIELLRLDLMGDDIITCGGVGQLIETWINEYTEYEVYDNNCQHFARDILSVFHIDLAKNITEKSKKAFVVGSGAPVFQFSDMHQELIRIDTMSQRLRNVLSVKKEETQQVRDWLSNTVHLEGKYIDLLIKHGFNTLGQCKYINKKILEQIGIQNAHHKEILKHVLDLM